MFSALVLCAKLWSWMFSIGPGAQTWSWCSVLVSDMLAQVAQPWSSSFVLYTCPIPNSQPWSWMAFLSPCSPLLPGCSLLILSAPPWSWMLSLGQGSRHSLGYLSLILYSQSQNNKYVCGLRECYANFELLTFWLHYFPSEAFQDGTMPI